jgi:hypothetical protein
MKAYKVLLIYYLKAVDEPEARRKALDLQKTDEPVEVNVVEVELRTERCDCCQRTHAKSDMRRHSGEYLCFYCDVEKYPEDYPGLW